jgi:thiamine biosynthesis lipoprotein
MASLGPVRHTKTAIAMDTFVSVNVVSHEAPAAIEPVLARALGWFAEVQRVSSRLDEQSELARLSVEVGQPVVVSTMLLQLTRFALDLARMSDGAYDPTVGLYESVSYRDVCVDFETGTITLLRPLVLDLSAVARGLAIDLAVRELDAFGNFCVDAGGDVFVRGHNELGTPWRVGVRHPLDPDEIVLVLDLSDRAVCTSGDHERPTLTTGELASVTVVAPTATMADGLATAAFKLGPEAGRRLLERHGAGGVLISPGLEVRTTAWFVEATPLSAALRRAFT